MVQVPVVSRLAVDPATMQIDGYGKRCQNTSFGWH
jgi:hypothetical protein